MERRKRMRDARAHAGRTLGRELLVDRGPLSEERIRDFDHEIRDFLGLTACPGYVVEPLAAGVRTELLYEKGALSSATLREDRHGGEDITRHIKTILTVPLSLSPLDAGMRVPDLLRVWGMVYMENQIIGCASAPMDRVMDMLVQPDLRLTARQPLNLFCQGVPRPADLHAKLGGQTHYEMMLVLQGLGLRVNRPHLRVCREIAEVVDYSFRLEEDITRFPYEIHGVLITLNPVELIAQIGETAPSPLWVIAFGFGES
jgi:DNA ligase (NAD+)